MIDRDTWIILADRLAAIRAACEELAAHTERIELVFDSHDQARLVPIAGHPDRQRVGSSGG